MVKRKPKVWLARDNDKESCYVLLRGEKPHRDTGENGGVWYRGGFDIEPLDFEQSSRIRLKPGEGPIEVNVKITRAKRKRKTDA